MKKRIIVGIICMIGFLITTILVVTNHTLNFDETIYQGIYGHHNQYLDFFFTHFTHIGDTIPVIVIALFLIGIFRKLNDRLKIGISLALTVAINQILKYLIARPRPLFERRLIKQNGYSFPSGHSMVALCICGTLIYFVMKKVKNKTVKGILVTLLTIMILLIGISRIYVGVHYPSDVLGGYLLTIPILILSISMINYHFKGDSK